ncbi:MAG: primosomal protein N' [Gemmatimonadetes bacterium]|nr:primosomal protein N' [Gemmatimonadota bacterium]
MRFVEVAVDVPVGRPPGAGGGPRTFTYSVPGEMRVAPGDLVWVPFGPRLLQGLVFATVEESPVEETRDILGRVEGGPFLVPGQLEVARWIAGHYRTGLFSAAAQMLPPGAASRQRTWLRRPARLPEGVDALRQREVRALSYVPPNERVRRDRVARRLGRGGPEVVDRLVRRGFLEAEFAWERPRVRPRYRSVIVPSVEPGAARARALELRRGRAPRRAALLEWLADRPEGASRAELVRRFGTSAVGGLLALGLAGIVRRREERDPLRGRAFQREFPHDPTPAQEEAIQAITAALRPDPADAGPPPARPSPGRFLVFGVTGSGKTEVFLQAAAACLDGGRQVLVLVPEIALTPQTLARIEGRFPGRVALQHSGLRMGERFDQWWAVKRGEYPIVLGSRGAVFAPLSNPGLVIIDEEHEWTYKQHDQAPRFHARDVAERLCAAAGAVLVLGSATPDVVTFRRAERGAYRLLRLPRRIAAGHGATPAGHARVQLVDMSGELRAGHTGMFSRALEAGIGEALEAGGRVILFLNRRGAASFVQCRDCGAVRRCRRCDTSLVYHRAERPGERAWLLCHYCGHRARVGKACPACGGGQMRRRGAGTQAVVEEVRRLFRGVRVIRWDRDVARSADEHTALMERFLEGDARVLVGTQMVAKGLDIPAVTLVGVVSADTGLAMPDFRAGERAFQVLAQVAGRAGRGPRGGRVVVQTFQPDHYAVTAAADQDYEAFYRTELALRARFANPPFTRLVRLLHSSPDEGEGREEALRFAGRLRAGRDTSGETDVEVLGPTPCHPFRVRGVLRWHIVLRGQTPDRLLDAVPVPPGWTVDVDPVSLA